MECVAYLRVSTEKQAEEGNGLDSQKRDIENYCRKNQLIISDWYEDDGFTGSNMNRPALQRLINDCSKKKLKCVVAFKLDRLSRSMVDGIYLIERVFIPNGVDFRCVHDSVSYDSPMEQAYTQMMAVFAQLDKNTMLLRMRGGMLERVKQGYWMGGGNTPYCYRYSKEDGILVPIPERKEMALRAMNLYISGYSDVRIQKLIGFKSEFVTRQVLTSPVNIGMIPYKGKLYKGRHEEGRAHIEVTVIVHRHDIDADSVLLRDSLRHFFKLLPLGLAEKSGIVRDIVKLCSARRGGSAVFNIACAILYVVLKAACPVVLSEPIQEGILNSLQGGVRENLRALVAVVIEPILSFTHAEQQQNTVSPGVLPHIIAMVYALRRSIGAVGVKYAVIVKNDGVNAYPVFIGHRLRHLFKPLSVSIGQKTYIVRDVIRLCTVRLGSICRGAERDEKHEDKQY